MRRLSRRILSSVLTGAMVLSLLGGSAMAVGPESEPQPQGEPEPEQQLTVADVTSIQVHTEEIAEEFQLTQVEITYQEDTDLSEQELTGESYILEGKTSEDGEFEQITISEVTAAENGAVLIVDGYTINNITSLDLRLRHTGEEETNALVMSEDTESNLWTVKTESQKEPPQEEPAEELTVDDIESIQAFTTPNFYGQRLYKIEVTFPEGTDMDAAAALDYKVWDRAFQKGEFEEGAIDSVEVDGNTVVLSFDQGPADNKPFGMLCTASWAIAEEFDEEGTSTGYEVYADRSGKPFNYFTREELDLVLAIGADASMEDGLSLTDGYGHYQRSKWQETVNEVYDDYDIAYVEAVDGRYYTEFDGKVPVHYQVPGSYDEDEGMPLVLYVTGNGTSYWEGFDENGNLQANNLGTNVTYDNATAAWLELGSVIVGSPDVHSQNNKYAGAEVANAIEYFQENYNITKVILIGNSNGTGICSQTMRDFPELVDVFICNNGWIGDGPRQNIIDKDTWPEESLQEIAQEGIAIWVIQGEQDPLANPIDSLKSYQALIPYYQDAGWSDEWIAENLRISAFKSYKFEEWGVNDHSCVKMSSWYYIDEPYLDVYEDGEPLEVGDTYQMADAKDEAVQNFEYVTYTESISDWVLNIAGGEDTAPATGEPTPIEEAEKADKNIIGSYQQINGYYTYQIDVGDDTREVEVYIPDGARQREYWITMALPSGVDSTQFLTDSGWFEIADETLACLLILKPEGEAWGDVQTELEYVNAAMGTLKSSGTYYSAFTYDYVVGYGDGAPAMQLWAAQNPLKMISQVYVNAQADEDYQDLLDAAGATQVKATPQPNNMDFEGYTDINGDEVTQKRTFAAQTYGDIPIPTWFAGNTSDSLIQYWQEVNDCLDEAEEDENYGQVYWQDKENSDAIATSFSDVKTQVAVSSDAVADMSDPELTKNINSFLTYYSGYDNNSVYGHFITERLPYTDEDSTNVIYRDHVWEGTNRTYIIYIPDSVKENGDEPAPLVVATHGSGQTAMVFFEATAIKEAADKYGFIAVTYDNTGNADYMVDMLELVKKDCEKAGVTVNEKRIYAFGQSAGGGAVANTLAQDTKTVELFAAFGSTSGTQNSAQKNGSNMVVPFYAIYGEYDYWPMKLGELVAGEWTGSMGRQYAWTTNTQSYWANRLLNMTLDELVTDPDMKVVSGITEDQIGSQSAPVSLIVNPTETANRYRSYIWSDDFGDGEVPIFVWTQCYGRGHNLVPGDVNRLWEEWFSKWEKGDDDNTLLYYENGVGHGEPIVVNQTPVVAEELDDLDDIQKDEYQVDYTQSAQIPLDGWYQKTFADGRTVEMYFPEYAACRAYFTVVAIPDGVENSTFWAQQQGYVDLMEQRGEVLVLLKPGADGWGTMDEELPYVTEAMSFVNSGVNANDVTLFTNYSTFYLVGYEKGAAALEAWAIDNPILVDSQAYINATAADADYRAETGSKTYDGTNTGGYDPGIDDDALFKQVLEAHGYEPRLIAHNEVPVPTWFVGPSDSESVAYWKSANDCLEAADGDVYWQAKDSDAFQTEYANDCTDEDHGISQVKVSDGVQSVTAQELAEFLYAYSRYNVPFAYSNHLSERQDYTSVRVAAQETAQSGRYLTDEQYVPYEEPITSDEGKEYAGYYVLAREQGEVGEGTVESGIVAFSDDNGDGQLDAREYLMYIPDSATSAGDGKVPVVFQYPGMTQSVSVGFDSTQWWRVANDYGVIVVIMGEAYNNGVALSWKNSDMAYHAVRDILEKDEELSQLIDWDRIYGSGHSLGSGQVQTFTRTHPEFFAAVASTSFASQTEGNYEAVPTMLVTGQSDLPFLMDDLWTADQLKEWFSYLAQANVLKVAEATRGNADEKEEGTARTWTYTWNNVDEIPMVVWGQTYLREHNCYPAEVPMAWEFLSHYSKDADGNRFYSASAFAEDDQKEIVEGKEAGRDLDSITDLEYDYSQAAQLPLTGWFTKNIDVDGNGKMDDGRTVKVYIAPEASIRSYFTIVAVPDGEDTYTFLEENGWFALADEKGEGLFVLEPGEGGWGNATAEKEYVDAAIAFLKSGNNVHRQNVFSTFGEFYVAGYGAGAAAVEGWAAANPIFVISQAYVGGTSAGDAYLDSVSATLYDGSSSNGDITDVLDETLAQVGIAGEMAPKDVPVPTWLAGYTGSEEHWKTANDCVADIEGDTYYQDIDSDAYATDYANDQLPEGTEYGISQVKVTGEESTAPTAAEIYEFLSIYTRYDNTFAYSNALAYRLDYTEARVAAQQKAKDGQVKETLSDGTQIWGQADVEIADHGTVQVGVIAFSDNSGDDQWDPREYILYIPDGFEGKELPILMIYPGNSQTDSIFMDSTLWWQIAEEEGIALVFVCETYSSSPSSVSHADSDIFYNSLITILEEQIDGKYADLDFTRIYGSGQSAGSAATQGFAITNPEFFAAVGSTSATSSAGENAANELIPSMLITGQMDMGNMPDGFASTSLQAWAKYMLSAAGIDKEFTAADATMTQVDSRHDVYSWSKMIDGTEISLVQWSECLLRPHNCYPSDMPILWDFVKHFSFVKDEDGSITRYYSPSAFEQDDLIVIDYIDNSKPVDDDDDDDDDDGHHSGGSSGSSTKYYSIDVENPRNGDVDVTPHRASAGTRVTIELDPDRGYEVGSVVVIDEDGDEVELTEQSETKYTFRMPKGDVEIEVSFVRIDLEPSEPDRMPFVDVSENAWFYNAVAYAYHNGLMSGTSGNTFSPDNTLTRAMIVQVLYAMEGAPAAGQSAFTDVPENAWYADAVNWAAENGIVSGYGNGLFGPEDNVTREQVATILYGYARAKGYGITDTASLAAFTDASSISAYAVDAMSWAVGAGLISGMGDGIVVPQGNATRAQFAVMLLNFCENVAR